MSLDGGKGAKEGEIVIPAKDKQFFTGIALDDQEEHLYVANVARHAVLKYEIANSTNEEIVAGSEEGDGLNQLAFRKLNSMFHYL